jgi:hypothetical protein
MHQLLQQAVGRELGWRGQCQRMRQLLHARCGRFGDEVNFDVGLYGVMREVAAAAVDAVGRVKEEGEDSPALNETPARRYHNSDKMTPDQAPTLGISDISSLSY